MENRAAGNNPTMSPTDPRWVLAVRAQSQLEGAALSPERREKLMQLANHLGIRSFDANLIVALVQDRARRGAPLDDLTGALTMLPISTRDENHYFWRWLMAGICGAFVAVMLIRWVLGVG